MLLADHEIKALLDDPQSGLSISDFDDKRLKGASYDLLVGDRVLISGQYREIELQKAKAAQLHPGDFAVVVTHDRFKVPQNMVLNIGPKTYLTKKGIVLQAGMQVDPGFEGHLVLGLYNSSPRPAIIEHLGDLCSVQFFKLREPAVTPVDDYPELQRGEIPRIDREYLYSLETKSLSNLGKDVRALTQTVGHFASDIKTLKFAVYTLLIPVALLVLAIFVEKFAK